MPQQTLQNQINKKMNVQLTHFSYIWHSENTERNNTITYWSQKTCGLFYTQTSTKSTVYYVSNTLHFKSRSHGIWHFCSYQKIAQSFRAVEYTERFTADGLRPPRPNECPRNETKQSDGEVPVILYLWGMHSTSSMPSLSSSLCGLYLIGSYLWVK